MESWGRKRRSVGNETVEKEDDDMNISQEILVLDFGDENNKDFLRSADPSTEFGRGKLKNTRKKKFYAKKSFSFSSPDKTVTIIEPCPTKTSVLALAVTCALMVFVYLCTLFCYYTKKWMSPPKMMP